MRVHLTGGESVGVEAWQEEVFAGEVCCRDGLEVRVVDPGLARYEAPAPSSSRTSCLGLSQLLKHLDRNKCEI